MATVLEIRIGGDVLGDVEGEGGLAHGGARGEDEEFAAVQAAGHFIELGEAGADALDALAGIEKGVDAAFELLDDLAGVGEGILGLRFAQLEQRLFGGGQDLVGLLFAEQRAVDQSAATVKMMRRRIALSLTMRM